MTLFAYYCGTKNRYMMHRQVVLYIAMSVDGFIADASDNIDFLSVVEKEGEDYGYAAFSNTIDTVIIGRKTYQKVVDMGFEYPHLDKPVYVVSRTPQPQQGHLRYYSGDLKALITQLKAQEGKDIYCDGGAEVVNALLREGLIDSCIISIVPVFLGSGIRLFDDNRPFVNLVCVRTTTYPSGLVQLHYKKQN